MMEDADLIAASLGPLPSCCRLPSTAGTFPASWSAAGSFDSLFTLSVGDNNLTGPLPEPVVWPQLTGLYADKNSLNGTLPASWAVSLNNLQVLQLDNNLIR